MTTSDTKTMSPSGLALTMFYEGCKLEAYQDGGGVWTIGFGHTKDVKQDDKCTYEQAIDFLQVDILSAVNAVNRLVTVSLNQSQFDALVDFTFNLGTRALTNSTLLRLLNSGNYEGAALEFHKWNHDNGKEVAGLTKRREAEFKLFESAE